MLSVLLGSLPPVASRRLRLMEKGPFWTAVGMSHFVETHLRAVRAFLDELDLIVVLCDWGKGVLLGNGVPEEKLVLCRHGLRTSAGPVPSRRMHGVGPLRLIFVGRAHPTKGLDLLIGALRRMPNLDVILTAFLVVQEDNGPYAARLRTQAKGDPRIELRDPIWDRESLLAELAQHDYLVVPSQWLETGPLVVLEAWAAGLPVVGSRLGGIAELVRHEVDGLLIEPGDERAWQRCLQRLAGNWTLLQRLREGIARPRTMQAVASEMALVYQRLASSTPDVLPRGRSIPC